MASATGVVFRRQLRLLRRSPVAVLIGLLQPVLYLVLFAPLLGKVAENIGNGNKYTLFVPGLLIQLALFGAAFTGYGVIGEWRDGVIEGERVTPAGRSALLLGRLLRDLVQLFAQVVILVALGYAIGMRAPFAQMAVGVVIAMLLGAAAASSSIALALTTRNERTMGSVTNTVLLPVVLLSGILLPLQIGPSWLERVADVVPIKHVVDGVRACFAGDLTSSSVAWGGGWAVVLCGLAVWWATAGFRKEA